MSSDSNLVPNAREIDVMQLSLEQLNQLKTQHEEEIQELNKQLEILYSAKNKFLSSKLNVENMSKTKENDVLLVPLTSSLYVPGTISNPEKVMVELGTGYYCEKTNDKAIELIERKIALVNSSIETVEGVLNQKRRELETIAQVMQYKLALLQQQKATATA